MNFTKEILNKIENIDELIDWNFMENVMKNRIWNSKLDSNNNPIPSKTGLYVSGELKNSFEVSGGKVSAVDYAAFIEEKYGDIFNLTVEELELIEKYIYDAIDK